MTQSKEIDLFGTLKFESDAITAIFNNAVEALEREIEMPFTLVTRCVCEAQGRARREGVSSIKEFAELMLIASNRYNDLRDDKISSELCEKTFDMIAKKARQIIASELKASLK